MEIYVIFIWTLHEWGTLFCPPKREINTIFSISFLNQSGKCVNDLIDKKGKLQIQSESKLVQEIGKGPLIFRYYYSSCFNCGKHACIDKRMSASQINKYKTKIGTYTPHTYTVFSCIIMWIRWPHHSIYNLILSSLTIVNTLVGIDFLSICLSLDDDFVILDFVPLL